MTKLRISGLCNDSIVDGPGLRYTIFTQGCPHHCPGCHNPQTHNFKGGTKVSTQEVFEKIKSNALLSGVTLSGGEPFMQAKILAPLVKKIKEELDLEVAAYSGFTFEELAADKEKLELLKLVDVLIDGKFILAQRSLSIKFRGSKNQRIINVQESLKANKAILEKSERWTK